MINTPITSSPRFIATMIKDQTNGTTWGLGVTFIDGETSNEVQWWYPTMEERDSAAEMWKLLIQLANLHNEVIDQENEEEENVAS